VQLNMIPKDGGQHLLRHRRTSPYTGPDLQSNNISDALLARGLNSSTDRPGLDQEVRRGGGRRRRPHQAEQAVVLRRGAKSITQQYAAGHLLEQAESSRKSMLYVPDLTAGAAATTSTATTARLTLQATEKNKFVVGGSFQHNCNCVYALFRPQGGSLGHA
jgi:hypothetical protein